MPTLGNAPIPANDAIARPKRASFGEQPDPLEGRVTTPWIDFFTRQANVVSQGPTRLNTVPIKAQVGSIAGTDFSGGNLAAGLYRISYYAQITRAATVSSSLEISFLWLNLGAVLTASSGAITGNTTSTWASGTILIRIDDVPINYAVTYASVGATDMEYSLDITLEAVDA